TARSRPRLAARSVSADGRQLVYRHGGLQIDLMLQAGGPAATFVWGQLCHTGTGRPCAGANVTYLDDHANRLTESATDAFGEFSFTAPKIVEGAIEVTAGASRFLCWLAPGETAVPRLPLGGRSA